METSHSNSTDNKIYLFLQGSLQTNEVKELLEWIRQSEANRSYFLRVKNLWESTQELPISTEIALQKVLKKIEKRHPVVSFWQTWQKIAAVLLIPLFIATLWLSLKMVPKFSHSQVSNTSVSAPFGSMASFQLPDGSNVWLNAGSSLEFPQSFTNNERTVVLKGEAYFEVASDTKCPFYVSTEYFKVKATGTRFNVMAYTNDVQPSVTLAEGKVAVLNQNNQLISTLKPNQHLVYSTKTDKATLTNDDSYKYLAWKDGRLVFRNDLLIDVAKRISRQYNVDIEVVGDSVQQYRFRASFENEPLNELLRLLKISSPINYTEVLPQYLHDGSFSKRKIFIYASEK